MLSDVEAQAVRTGARPTVEQVLGWLHEVADPEIPVISVVDLGIVRGVRWNDEELVITITPTYAGCPAMTMIAEEIRKALTARGVETLRLETRLSPAWTTDWLSAKGRANLREYGIAPPVGQRIDISSIRRVPHDEPIVVCPHCGSSNTALTSRFGSTACKALYKCSDCLEPFDYFKPH